MTKNPELSELYGGPEQLEDSIFAALENGLAKSRHKPAVIAMHQRSDHLAKLVRDANDSSKLQSGIDKSPSYLIWTYDQLHRGAVKLAAAFEANGIGPGSTVVTLLPNCADWTLIHWATALSKLNMASLDRGALQPPRRAELENLLKLLQPDVVFVSDSAAAQALDIAAQSIGVEPRMKITLDTDTQPQGWTSLAYYGEQTVDARVVSSMMYNARKDDPNRTAVTMFTSGTSSGKPKGCPRPVISILHAMNEIQSASVDEHMRFLLDSTNFRTIVLITSLLVWKRGGTMVMSGPAATPDGALKAIQQQKIDALGMVPAMLRAITEQSSFTKEKVASVCTVFVGGDMVTKGIITSIEANFTNARVINTHGMSEGGKFFDWPLTHSGESAYYGELAALGTVAKGVHIKVVDHDQIVRRGAPGELHVDSRTMVRQYLENASADSFYYDGDQHWFRTGDTAIITKEGLVYIIGRSKDIIKRAGVPITPAAIESCLQAFTNSQVAVLGVPHETLDNEPFAILTTFGGKTEEQLKARVVDMFGEAYALGGAVGLEQLGLDEMPLNQTGKIQKLNLQEPLATHLSK